VFGQLVAEGPGGFLVQMDTVRGLIGFGDTAGHRITYNFNYPWERGGNYMVFAIDDSGYSNVYGESMYGFTYLGVYSGLSAYYLGTLSRNWRVPFGAGEFYFQISVRPIELNEVGVAKIDLYAFNGDAIPHDIGAMMGLDIKIGSNDRARFATGSHLLSEGTLLSGNNIPYFWQAFEVSPGAGCEQVIARGYLKGLEATAPDRFALGDQYYLQLHPWEIDSSFIGIPYYDSAILMRWAKQRVNPDKSVQFTTYIGFGECVDSDDDVILVPLITSRLRPQCDCVESPFEVAGLVHNLSLSEGVSDGMICISIPEGIELTVDPMHTDDTCITLGLDPLPIDSSDVESWLLSIVDSSLWGDSIWIALELYGEPDVEIMETSWVHIPSPDGNLPVCELDFPYTFIGCVDTGAVQIPFYLWDDTQIDPHSVSVKLGDHLLLAVSGYFIFTEESLYVELPPWAIEHGETLELQMISATDIYGCSPDIFPEPETIIVDLNDPVFVGFDPPSGSVSQTPQVRLLFEDRPAGIDPMSLDLLFDGVHIPPDDPRIYWEYDSVMVFTADETFPDGYPLTVCMMTVADRTQLCGPHINDTPVCITYEVSAVEEVKKPLDKCLLWVSPNPFNKSCQITFYSPSKHNLHIEIFDVFGRVVKNFQQTISTAGTHNFFWTPADNLPSGIYIISAKTSNYTIATSTLLLK